VFSFFAVALVVSIWSGSDEHGPIRERKNKCFAVECVAQRSETPRTKLN